MISILATISTAIFIGSLLLAATKNITGLILEKSDVDTTDFAYNQMYINLVYSCRIIALISLIGSLFLWIFYFIAPTDIK